MPKPEFGKKVICGNCGVKFYDLNRKPATCPSCGTEYKENSNETIATTAKQVFVDDVDTVADDNLVGSNATESIAEVSDLSLDDELDDELDDDTISLEDTEADDQVMTNDEDLDIDTDQSTQNIDQD
tara:strand:- start:8 stop:388 length:381 start_codon:yes stop_codon:yes gene_type:complete